MHLKTVQNHKQRKALNKGVFHILIKAPFVVLLFYLLNKKTKNNIIEMKSKHRRYKNEKILCRIQKIHY